MTTTTPESVSGEIAQFLTELYDLEITATADDSIECQQFGVLASYVDSDENIKGQILCDLPLAAMLGAALTHIPMGGVEDAIASGRLPENLSDNLAEVLNIAVNLFPHHESSRLVLKDVVLEGTADQLQSLESTVKLAVAIQRYGQGCMVLTCNE